MTKRIQIYNTDRSDRLNQDGSSELSTEAANHILDQLCKAAIMVEESIDNSQSNLSDYASLASSSA